MSTQTATTTQVHRVWIKASPEAVWDAITKPEWMDRYGYGGFPDWGEDPQPGPYTIEAGSAMQAAGASGAIVDGEIVTVDPPRRFAITYRMLMAEDLKAEGFTRVTYDVHPMDNGVTRLTITHELDGAPELYALVGGELADTGAGGGWAWILSDLKSLLETGERLGAW
jgi:uncharacterized protein YndB with AHSA1/START domain